MFASLKSVVTFAQGIVLVFKIKVRLPKEAQHIQPQKTSPNMVDTNINVSKTLRLGNDGATFYDRCPGR